MHLEEHLAVDLDAPASSSRRHLLRGLVQGLGAAGLAATLPRTGLAAEAEGAGTAGGARPGQPGLPGLPHLPPRAQRAIFLTQSGAPSQMDLFDHKPRIAGLRGKDLPPSVHMGQRLTTMTAGKGMKIQPSTFKFARHGQSGAWVSELLPHTAKIVDDLCFVRSMQTEAINHAPGMTQLLTGHQQPGRPSLGAWLAYGLGTANPDLPASVVMLSRDRHGTCGQLLFDYYWGAGFLPSKFQGVKFRGGGEPVLYQSDPPGVSREMRADFVRDVTALNRLGYARRRDPEILTRNAQYEMAFRMQDSVPELTDLSNEPRHVLDLYGPEVERPGSYAWNCLMARRLSERGVRFVQLFHPGWDTHKNLERELRMQCEDTDRASAALVTDLKQRGLLDDTLVFWGGEFGRTVFSQGHLDSPGYGRDHHPRCFTVWLAGGGIKAGLSYGETDEFSYNVVKDPVHVHDLQATVLHLLGVNHERLTFRFQGRNYRLTDIGGHLIERLFA
jgi:hypothetical protein